VPDTAHLLPVSATPWEKAVGSAVAAWWSTLPVDLIGKALDPYAVPVEWLDWLANTLSVDLWRGDWSELKKRDVIAQAPTLQTLKTTLPGLAAHLAIMDARIVQSATPPGGFFLGRAPTVAEMEAWFATLPQVRVYFVSEERKEGPELYWGDSFYGEGFWLPDLAPTIQRRKAVLFDRGVETPLVVTTLSYSDAARKTPAEERVTIEGRDGPALFFADGFYGADDHWNALERAPKVFTYRFDRTWNETVSHLAATALDPSYTPQDVRSTRQSAERPQGPELICNDGFWAADNFWLPDVGYGLAYDRVVLHDPARPGPVGSAAGFWGADRYGQEAYTVELIVDVPATLVGPAIAWSDGFWGDGFLEPHDPEPFERAAEAINVAKANRDEVRITLATHRPRTFADGFPPVGTPLNTPVLNFL